MRVLVTGAAGFLGSHLLDALVQAGYEVTGVDNLRRGRIENIRHLLETGAVRFEALDIRDYAELAETMSGVEVVYHLAAQSTVMEASGDPEYTLSTNVGGTCNVVRAAAAAGVRRVVFASSREVYGECERLPVEEESPAAPKNLYGATKVAGEAIGRSWQASTGLEWQVLRFGNLYGSRDFDRVIPRWLECANSGRAITLYGGDQVLDFLWVGYAVKALVTAGRCKCTDPVNVASGQPTSLRAVVSAIQALMPERVKVDVASARSEEVSCFVAHVGRMKSRLDVSPPVEPLDHLSETATWYLTHASAGKIEASSLSPVAG